MYMRLACPIGKENDMAESRQIRLTVTGMT
jgi:hypothetical protein